MTTATAGALIAVVFAVVCVALALWVIAGHDDSCDCPPADPYRGLSPDARRLLGVGR